MAGEAGRDLSGLRICLLVPSFLLLVGATAVGQDFKLYALGKAAKFEQTDMAAPVLVHWDPLIAALGFDLSEYAAIAVTRPGGDSISLVFDEGNWMLEPESQFDTEAELNSFLADSASPYTFVFTPSGGGSAVSGPLLLDGGGYPSVPQVTNLADGHRINPESDFMLTWEAFAGAGADDFILLSVRGESGSIVDTPPPPLDGALGGTATSYLIPSGVLEPGMRYSCEIGFYRSADRRTGDVANATGLALYSIRTEFELRTLPVVAVEPADHTVPPGGRVLLSVTAEGVGSLEYQWRRNTVPIPGETSSVLHLQSVSVGDAGTYDVRITDSVGQTSSVEASLSVEPGVGSTIVNLSNRSLVLTGSGVMIPGFVISGSGSKRLLVRAVGPTLSGFGVNDPLADPKVVLFNGATSVADNDDWNASGNVDEIRQVTAAVSAFALPEGSADAVVLADLDAGAYTVQASGVDGVTGVALVELYDGDTASAAELTNLSNRGYVGTGGSIMIPGFVVTGSASKTVLIRVVGPTLARFGLGNLLENPRLKVFSGNRQIAENDDWQASPAAELIESVAGVLGAFDLDDGSQDAAVLMTLAPGAYTVQASGVDGTTGVALVEIYVAD